MDKNTELKLEKILKKHQLTIVNSEVIKNKYYLDLSTTDSIIFSINFSLLALQQSSAKSIENQILKKLNKKKTLGGSKNEICN